MDRRKMRRGVWLGMAVGAGALLAGCVDYPPPPPPGPPPPPYAWHVRRCFARHPNYNPQTNTWWDAWGYPHPCRA